MVRSKLRSYTVARAIEVKVLNDFRSTVSMIGKNFLISIQLCFETRVKYSLIWPITSCKWSIGLNYMFGSKANTDFVSYSWTPKFMWVPLRWEWFWFLNSNICTIDRNACSTVFSTYLNAILQSFLKFYLAGPTKLVLGLSIVAQNLCYWDLKSDYEHRWPRLECFPVHIDNCSKDVFSCVNFQQ